MAWHIFRKDVRLLWPIALAVAGANALYRVLLAWLALSQQNRFVPIFNMLTVLSLMGTAILIAMAVQQDALPGVRQDWLSRPVRRRDLFLSKLFFTLLIVQAPIFLVELAICLANGFPAGRSLGAALDRSTYLFVAFDLPVLAFATLTRNLVEAVGAALGATLLFAMIQTVTQFTPIRVILFSPLSWVVDSAQIAAGLAGAVVVIALQYSLRRTIPARWSALGAGLLWAAAQAMPWQPAFAIQRQFAPKPAAGNPVMLAFNARAGRFHNPPGMNYDEQLRRAGIRGSYADLVLPVKVSGVSEEDLLRPDLASVRVTAANGITAQGRGGGLQRDAKGDSWQLVWVPEEFYEQTRDRNVKLQIDYLLTLLSPATAHSMPARGGDQRTDDAGRCRTGVNVTGTAIQWQCFEAGLGPPCLSAFLENPQTGQRNPLRSECPSTYAPYMGGTLFQDAMSRFRITLPFRDPNGLARYPVDGTQLAASRVVFRAFRPQAHFERKLVIEDMRLSDWRVE
jgi:hypothetical protein